MADLHSTPDITVSGTERRLLVGYRPNGRDISTPSLPLSGKWLREAGFGTGKPVTVKVMDGCILLLPLSDKRREANSQITVYSTIAEKRQRHAATYPIARAGKFPGLHLPPDPGDKTANASPSSILSDTSIFSHSGLPPANAPD
ncbi:type I toxin-antitoxin system SymE family toxin [Klebsiella pneumoniae]|nr:type I toxin-antitoxin system SymE family toxin [Klebsiella pneumoniae]HDS7061974.1 type I toxin-antitoxin system SymE family toxin [Klebsiella pneumoniae subsp. pneumoniae]EKT9411166.1 type I toxin-antitoxin system SymE family toxin [Klebsiella pneumoniae]EKU5568007.1 type I toxin-antitoxin system SymE family toxin [Klebsiella pneumoniae]EKU8574359.1 type I toxin-antitoxin system SymE family toxin [Klebsiella pneumoniae]